MTLTFLAEEEALFPTARNREGIVEGPDSNSRKSPTTSRISTYLNIFDLPSVLRGWCGRSLTRLRLEPCHFCRRSSRASGTSCGPLVVATLSGNVRSQQRSDLRCSSCQKQAYQAHAVTAQRCRFMADQLSPRRSSPNRARQHPGQVPKPDTEPRQRQKKHITAVARLAA